MKNKIAILTLLASAAFAADQSSASWASTSLGPKPKSEPATQSRIFKVSPAPASSPDSSPRGRTFQVNDVKGLLLTCIAPQLDTDPDTDIFNGCTLAPGRTLDDVMHTFIQGIHFELQQHLKERAEWSKELEEKQAEKPAQK